MYFNAVRRSFYTQLDKLTDKGVPDEVIACEEQAFVEEMDRLERLCGREQVPDLWLYWNWNTPVELGLFKREGLLLHEMYKVRKKQLHGLRVPAYAINAQLRRIDEIMLRVCAFAK